MLVAAISDTHLPRGARRLPEACLERLAAADLILHGGDFSTVATLRELEAVGPPVRGVFGNADEPELLLNPGSPTERRRGPFHAMLMLEIAGRELRPEAGAAVRSSALTTEHLFA